MAPKAEEEFEDFEIEGGEQGLSKGKNHIQSSLKKNLCFTNPLLVVSYDLYKPSKPFKNFINMRFSEDSGEVKTINECVIKIGLNTQRLSRN